MTTDKQKKLSQDYADFLVEHAAAKAQGKVLGNFLEWIHATGRVQITIRERGGK
ncbi:hypothetical protein [Propionivibrio sp.]|uniref:hypothetical protein n=1 Tax=Propionivibrio sp. TaxID=2212460 RepID=UPI003BF2A319